MLKKLIATTATFATLAATTISLSTAPAFAAVPGGSYTRTCIGIEESKLPNGHYRLSAQCKDKQGNVVNAYLDNYRTCKPNTITNNNGRLSCQRR